MGDTRSALALDVGGTKLAAGVVDPGGRLLTWARTPTPAGLDAEQLWRTLDALFTSVTGEVGDCPKLSWPAWAAAAAGPWSGRPAGCRR